MQGDVVMTDGGAITNLHHLNQESLPMWVIYRPTTQDYPGQWVARFNLTLPKDFPSANIVLAPTLDELRDLLPPGLYCLERMHDDDPVIEEVWM